MKIFTLTAMVALFAPAMLFAAPQFTMDGTIVNAGMRIKMGGNGEISVTNEKGVRWVMGMDLVANGKIIPPKELGGSGLDVAKSKKLAVHAGTYAPAGGTPFGIEYSLAMTSEDNARIALVFKTAAPVEKIFSRAGLTISIPRSALAGERLRFDEKEVVIAAQGTDQKSAVIYEGAPSSMVWFVDDPSRRLALAIRNAGAVTLNDEGANVVLHLMPKDNEITLDILLGDSEAERSSGEVYANIDFWSSDKLKMPRYKLSKNLVQNPGFEDGLKYWTLGPIGKVTEARLGEHYLVEENGRDGRRSLKILGEKGQMPAHIATFAIPVEADAEYTVSFYAKADRSGVRLASMPFTAVWGKFPGGKDYELSTEWKRYSNTFKVPNATLALDFGINEPVADCAAWIDAVQLQKGPLTNYEEKPCGVSLTTARRDNFFQPGDKTGAAFYVHGKPLAKGMLTVRVTDFAGVVVKEDKLSYTIGEKGHVSLPATWADTLATGLYIVESALQSEDGFTDREFDRLAIMPSARGLPVFHDKFFCALCDSRRASWPQLMERFNHIGISSVINFDPEYPAFREEMKKAGIFYFSSIFTSGENGEQVAGKWNISRESCLHQSAADLAIIEEAAYQRAKENPDTTAWKSLNEPGPDGGGGKDPADHIEEMKKVVKCMAAARKGIFRFNPKSLFLTPDPANMYPTGGIKYIDTFLAAGGKDICDIVAIHPYRPRPEEPDLDADTAKLLSVLAKHGFTGDVWFTEGIYHPNYVIPALGLDAHKGCSSDHYRGGPLTYYMGQGERMSFAYTMRSWLAALKYADRVKLSVDWAFTDLSMFGADMTPYAKSFASNVLTRILGNAKYKADVDFGREMRCYVFEDKQKRPVAAVWTHNIIMDTEGKPGPKMNLSLIPTDTEFIDCMGKTIGRPVANEIMISSFPVFLRGKPKTFATFRDALAKTQVGSGEVSPVDAFAQLLSPSEVEISVRNLLSRNIDGRMKISDSGAVLFDKPISIAGKDTWKFPVIVKKDANTLAAFGVKTEFTPSGVNQPIINDIALEIITVPKVASPLVMDGDLSGWPARAEIPLPARFVDFQPYGDPAAIMDLKRKYPAGVPWKGEADLSATLYAAWDAENLYLAVKVKDDVFSPAATIESAWTGDGVQLYFDCWGDARQHATKGYDNNDQVFDLWPSSHGLVVNRAVAPEQQLAFLKTGVVSNLKTAFKRIADGYVCEVALPLREVAPIKLQPGAAFGFALIVNDNDGDYRKRGLTLTPPGTEPHMRPDLYPVMILDK